MTIERSDRIRLHPAVARCCAGPDDCTRRSTCARAMAYLPQHAGLENFAARGICSAHISLADAHASMPTAARQVKPALPGMWA